MVWTLCGLEPALLPRSRDREGLTRILEVQEQPLAVRAEAGAGGLRCPDTLPLARGTIEAPLVEREQVGGDVVIQNLAGSGADIIFRGAVRAENLTVVASGSVFIDGVTSYSLGGESYSQWHSVTDITELNFGENASSDAAISAVLAVIPQTVNLYGDKVFINAQYLNVNGILQSGKSNYVVNIGDLFARWTNQRYVSTLHRVINRSGRERYSVPFFFTGNPLHQVECLPGCLAPGEVPRYAPVTVEQHLMDCYRRTYG